MSNKTPTKNVTCALAVITPSRHLVIAHPTNAPYWASWSLPKGIADEDEHPSLAAARECFEETGLDFRADTARFIDAGRHPYVKGKDLHLFVYYTAAELDETTLHCSSLVTAKDGTSFPECDHLKVASLVDAEPLLNKKQLALLQAALLSCAA